MSLFGRALAGAGSAAANLAQQYINAEMEQQKAQALADIQFASAKRMDEYNLSDERQGRVNAAEAARERAVGAARNETALEGKRAEASDAQLTEALAGRETIMGKARNKVEIERATEMLPLEVRRAAAVADAQGKASARYRQSAGADIDAKMAAVEKALGRPMTEQEKLGLLGLAKGRDPELDTETVTEEKINPDGSTTKVQRKQVRRPGNAPAAPQITPEQAHQQAKDAVAKGAPLEAVNARLKEAGFDPLPSAGGKTGAAPRAPLSPEQQLARRISNMDDRTLAAYQKMQNGEPTTPRERQWLRQAGVMQ